MNEKKITSQLYCFIFLCGMLFGGIAISCGYYFLFIRPYRTVNRQLTEQLQSLREETDKYREELAANNRKLEQSVNQLQSVREELRESIDTVQSSYSDLTTIRTASETIRTQVKILSDYYTDTRNIYNSLCNDNDNSNKQQVDK